MSNLLSLSKAGSIVDLGLFSIQLTRSDNLDHLDLTISKESKRTGSTCCDISVKSFCKETVSTASVPQKYIALFSAVTMNIDQRALQDGSSVVGHDNDSPTYRILQNSTSKGGSYGNKILYKNLNFFDKIFVRKSCRRRFRNAPYGEKSC